MSESSPLGPASFFRSFLLVCGAYIGCYLANLAIFFVLAFLFFPATFELYSSRRLTREEFVEQIDIALPMWLFWSSFALGMLVCAIAGGLVYRVARLMPQAHVVFLALILFFAFLQDAIMQPVATKWASLVKMAGFSLAVLVGAQWVATRYRQDDNSTLESAPLRDKVDSDDDVDKDKS